jgi:rSAM/selenodomain-associated transferase 1
MITVPHMADRSSILFFVKHPAAGNVKSRIAAAIGDDNALALYRDFILDMLDTIERTSIPCIVCVSPPDAVTAMSAWLGSRRTYLPQIGSDLGERMELAFRAIFAQGIDVAFLIGSDLPDLPGAILREAQGSLGTNEAVIGPAQDGGYYLIGFRKDAFLPDAFRDMTWSRPDVFERTMQVLRQKGLRTHTLPSWQDLDTLEDLRELERRSRGTGFSASRTMRRLASIIREQQVPEVPRGEV